MSEETYTAPPAFIVAAFEAIDTAVLDVLNQKEEPLLFDGRPVTIEMYGPGSDVYVKAQAKIDAASQARAFAAIRGKAPKDAATEARNGQIEKLVACTKTINNFPIPGGARELFSNQRLGYITVQAQKFHDDWANFPAASSTT